MSAHDPRVVIRTEDAIYIGWAPDDGVAPHRDPRAAFVYDRIEDHIRIQLEEVRRLYGKVWTAVPLAQALADGGWSERPGLFRRTSATGAFF